MLPWEFERLTPAELDDLLEGYRERDLRQWQHEAWMVAHLMNISGKSLKKGSRIKPEDLLPKSSPARQRKD